MDFLTLLAGQTVAFNPLSVFTLSCIGWLISVVTRNKNELKEQMASLDKQLAIVRNNQENMKAGLATLVEDQKRLLKTVEHHHNQNMRMFFRKGLGASIMSPGDEAASEND